MAGRRSFGDWFFDHGITLMFWGVGILIAALVIAPIGYTWACYQNDRTITCTVEDKDRGGDGTMRVYTEDCGNFVVQDATFAKNFHSSDTYRGIEPGGTYRLHVNGYRIPFLSEFPNILDAEAVS